MGVQNIAVMIKTLNLITGVGLVVISVLSILDIKDWFTFKVFLLPCPFFIAFFGLAIIGAELKVKIILKKLSFLEGLTGRGLFNIFLSSMSFWFLQNSEVLAWISALALFIIGVIYVAMDCGYGKELRQQFDKEEAKREKKSQDETSPVRENLI